MAAKESGYTGAFRGAFQPKQSLLRSYNNVRKLLAGVVGFEPTIFSTKNCCLTTWPHPISEPRSSASFRGAQEALWKKWELFLRLTASPEKSLSTQYIFPDLDQDSALSCPCFYSLMGGTSL
jgi:hypothetical protein